MQPTLKDLKQTRLEQLTKLPETVQLESLIDWKTTTAMCGCRDIERTRRAFRQANVPLVHVSERIKLPRLRSVLAFLAARERAG
jgi:hypothetical protein